MDAGSALSFHALLYVDKTSIRDSQVLSKNMENEGLLSCLDINEHQECSIIIKETTGDYVDPKVKMKFFA
jgi:hypothetical protein